MPRDNRSAEEEDLFVSLMEIFRSMTELQGNVVRLLLEILRLSLENERLRARLTEQRMLSRWR